MKKLAAFCCTLSVILAVCVQPALGQYESSQKSPIGLGFSMVRPSDSRLRDITGTWFGATLDWNIKHDALDRPMIVGSVGWFGKSEIDARGSFVPFKLAYIKHLDESSESSWYVGGGLSAYYVNYEAWEQSVFTQRSEWVDERGFKMGFNVVGGREFGGGWYAELRYDVTSSLSLPTGSSVDFGGMTLTIGSRLAF